jgi:hypothetical protein
MTKFNLGQAISVLANVGVLVGILLLVFELNQNRQMMKAQVRYAVTQGGVELLTSIASDESLANIVTADCSATTSCSPTDQTRFNSYWSARFRYWEGTYYLYRIGLYDETEYRAQREAWRANLQDPSVRRRWESVRFGYAPEFVTQLDALLPE